MKSFILFSLYCLLPSFHAQGQQWNPTNGPYGGTANVFLKSSSQLYVGTISGLYTSDDKGNTWLPVSDRLLDNTNIQALLSANDTLFVGSGGGLFRSADGKTNWKELRLPEDVAIISLISSGNALFAGSAKGVFRSENKGDSWTTVNQGLPQGTSINDFAKIDGMLLAATSKGVFVTTDNGDLWTKANKGLPGSSRTLTVAVGEKAVFAGTNKGVYRSTNQAASWEPLENGLPDNVSISTLDFADTTLLAGTTNAGIYKSDDQGDSWTPVSAGLPTKSAVKSMASSGDVVLVGITGSGIYRSTDKGNIWILSNYAIKSIDPYRLIVSDKTLFTGTNQDGIYRSTDQGKSWIQANNGFPLPNQVWDMMTLRNDVLEKNILFVASDTSVFRSTDEGNTWSKVNNGLPTKARVMSLTGSKNNTVFASLEASGIYRSTDYGFSWAPVADSSVRTLEFRSMFAKGIKIFAGSVNNGLYYSPDDGITWGELGNGFFRDKFIKAFAQNEEAIFVGTFSNGLFRSTDEGVTWQQLDNTNNLNPAMKVSELEINGSSIFVSTYGSGVFRSVDSGNTWTLISEEIPNPIQFNAIATTDSALYVATRNRGVWTRSFESFYTKANGLSFPDAAKDSLIVDGSYVLTTPPVFISLNQNIPGTVVNLVTRGITRDTTNWKSQELPDAGNSIFAVNLPAEQFDVLGLRCYFEVIPPKGYGPAFTTSQGLVRVHYPEGLPLPHVFGKNQTDYRLISVPLDLSDKVANSVFRELGESRPDTWRLFRYNPKKAALIPEQTDKHWDASPNIVQGQGYWLINNSKDTIVYSGEGYTLPQNKQPITIRLDSGWNQIGNPYLLKYSWQKLKQNSNKPNSLHRLWTYSGKVATTSDVFEPYSGGFVFADEEAMLTFPVERDVSLNGARVTANASLFDSTSYFESNFTLSNGAGRFEMGGLGLHPRARIGRDQYDEYNPPRWVNFLELTFSSKFGKDMQPVKENQIWEFTVETNLEGKEWVLNWQNYFQTGNAAGKQLVLYNLAGEQVVDMLSQDSCLVRAGDRLRVVYGEADFVEKHTLPESAVLGQPYPNPFQESTLITFTLPESTHLHGVELSVYDLQGRKLATLAEGGYPGGRYQAVWEGRGHGSRLMPGLYICRLRVAGQAAASLTRKVIVK